MAVKKKKRKKPAIPEWVVTFGDLMSLLLTFFILLQMFSEIKRDHEYQRVVTAVQEAFGYSGGIGVLPIKDPPMRSMIEQLEQLAMKNYDDTKISQANVRGVDGPHMRVTRVRDGLIFTIGGPATFDEYSAEVKPAVREELAKLAKIVRGRNNRLLVRGHAAQKLMPDDQPWRDLDDLAFERARNVRNALIDLGVRNRVFRLEAVGAREPLQPRVTDPTAAQENRRVDVVLTEQLVEETHDDPDHTSPEHARGM